MWFNILKNDERRAAYRFFRNSIIHQGKLIPPKDIPEKIVDEGDTRLYSFETSNGHFKFEVEYDTDGLNLFYLDNGPPIANFHIEYIEGMFEQEYPELYAELKKFFVEKAPELKAMSLSERLMTENATSSTHIFERWNPPMGISRHFKTVEYNMKGTEGPAQKLSNTYGLARYYFSRERGSPISNDMNFNPRKLSLIANSRVKEPFVSPDDFFHDFMTVMDQTPTSGEKHKLNTEFLENVWLQILYNLYESQKITIGSEIISAYKKMEKENAFGGFDDLADLFS